MSAAEPGTADRQRRAAGRRKAAHATGVYRELKICRPALRDGLCRFRKEELKHHKMHLWGIWMLMAALQVKYFPSFPAEAAADTQRD